MKFWCIPHDSLIWVLQDLIWAEFSRLKSIEDFQFASAAVRDIFPYLIILIDVSKNLVA